MISESFCYSRVLRTTASENPNLVNQASHQTNRAITQRSDGENGGYPPAGERGRGRGHRDPPSTDLHARRRGATDQQPHQADKDTRATRRRQNKQQQQQQHNRTGGQQVHAKGATIRYDSWQRLIMSRVQTFTKNMLQRIAQWETSKNAIGLKM